MRLYNTLSRTVEDFNPVTPPHVGLYECGPTVYDYTHIGHIRTYINIDVLKRALRYLGYNVNDVMNITDVGHLTGDDDEGEDKLEKGAAKSGKTVWDVAKFYTKYFNKTMERVNVLTPAHVTPATKHIPEMIELIKKLEEKGHTYQTEEAVYFDVKSFDKYGALSGQNLDDKIRKARDEVHVDEHKKHPADFALWFFRRGRFADHVMHWESPWGDGFPGWHIECSAMAMKYLGGTIDIHTGGIDHIPVHHENEIAQSEAATGKQFVKYWFHNAFLMVDGQKMSKSLGNFYTIDDIDKQAVDPLAIRLLFLQSHYRQTTNFTWEAAAAAQNTLSKLRDQVINLKASTDRPELSPEKMGQIDQHQNDFKAALENDLNVPQAIAVMWSAMKSNIPPQDKLDLIFQFDQVFGLKLNETEPSAEISSDIKLLVDKRDAARLSKDFAESDRLRKAIEDKGYVVKDTPQGTQIKAQ